MEETPAMGRMIDEDAFGILLSYYEVEDDEYCSDEREEFVARFEAFERGALEIVAAMSLPSEHHVVCFGHAVYVELRDGEDAPELLRSVRSASAQLNSAGFVNVTVLSHGSRWVVPGKAPELSLSERPDRPRVARISRPSEPLRRALDVATLSRRDEQVEGWGPGVYVDTEALEALGKTPKNAPTVLQAPGAQFYRIPPLPAEAR
jgi:hypothetical protein